MKTDRQKIENYLVTHETTYTVISKEDSSLYLKFALPFDGLVEHGSAAVQVYFCLSGKLRSCSCPVTEDWVKKVLALSDAESSAKSDLLKIHEHFLVNGENYESTTYDGFTVVRFELKSGIGNWLYFRDGALVGENSAQTRAWFDKIILAAL